MAKVPKRNLGGECPIVKVRVVVSSSYSYEYEGESIIFVGRP
ncbi:MAG: hypothetical protein SNG02_00355 [Rikenellaceae bacterium]